ncbi:uncharacterized protein LOC130706606 isoform X1 [Balaenoptera acutorostrata]|uniref:Uncharacterized protein LOC130706606 isoform X1 n=1 Tax=Balaenoptera acutorostrata TaxID=9767 RepID=A0ABM3SZJ1_BALAC|nr:uncharacterized protein LOC130706606 isoform X1 [Balaenoptera acutorostrata]
MCKMSPPVLPAPGSRGRTLQATLKSPHISSQALFSESSGTPRYLCEYVSATSWATCSGAVSGTARSSTGPCTSMPSPCTAACPAGTPCVSACPSPQASASSCSALLQRLPSGCILCGPQSISDNIDISVSTSPSLCLSVPLSLCLPFSCANLYTKGSISCMQLCLSLCNLMNLGTLTLLIRNSSQLKAVPALSELTPPTPTTQVASTFAQVDPHGMAVSVEQFLTQMAGPRHMCFGLEGLACGPGRLVSPEGSSELPGWVQGRYKRGWQLSPEASAPRSPGGVATVPQSSDERLQAGREEVAQLRPLSWTWGQCLWPQGQAGRTEP